MIKKILSLVTIGLLFSFVNCSSLPVLDAVEAKSLDKVKKAVEGGGNPNEGDCLGALTVAAWNGNADIVEYLLSKGADPNQRGRQCEFKAPYIGRYRLIDRTPMQGVKDLAIAKMLLDKGANVNLGGFREYTDGDTSLDNALETAIQVGNPELVELYLKQKVNLKVYSLSGKNIFLTALNVLKKENPEKAGKIESLLKGKISDLELTDSSLNATEGKILKNYVHIPTGAKTTMPEDIAQKLYENPRKFAPITFNSGDNQYHHYAEFNWDNGQNMYEWYILRNAKVNPKKKK